MRASGSNVAPANDGIAPKKPKLSAGDLRARCCRKWNITSVLRNSETHGRCVRRYDQLPANYIHIYQDRFRDVDSLPDDVRKLFDFAKEKDFSLKNKALQSCLEKIKELIDTKPDAAAIEFCYCGGIEIIVDMLVRAYYDLSSDIYQDKEIKKIPAEEVHTVSIMLQTLHTAAQIVPIEISHLCDRPHLLHLLLSLFVDDRKRIFVDATLLLEEMILSQPHRPSIDVRNIACLPAILTEELSYQQEAHLFHVLATIISVCDTHLSVDTSLREHDRWLANGTRGELNRANQEFLINTKPFLDKLFRITCRQLRLQLPDIFRDSIRHMSLHQNLPEDRLVEMFIRNLSQTDSPIYQNSLYHEKSIRADTFLLLSMLLSGKCRDKMQESILEYKVVQGLESCADNIVWSPLSNPGNTLTDSQMDRSPVSTVKVQFLRLIYSISDHHLHRYLLLSKQELNEIKQISEQYSVPLHEDFSSLDQTSCCQKHPGMLTTIISKIKEESGTSYIRFWMTRALEAFLRGAVSRVDQIFFIKKGLLQELFRVILAIKHPSTEVIQGHFDLLATLMRGSVLAFEKFSEIVDCHGTFQKLCDIIRKNLVDSNMFVRCVVLTIDSFQSEYVGHETLIENCRILKYYSNRDERVRAVVNLVRLLCVETLSQENVSCLNTSIIILLIARKNNELPCYLSSILHHDEEISNVGPEILRNLRELLEFWLEHYSYPFKQSDIKSLEESTAIPFMEWKSLTKDLITEDSTSPNSIMHHLASVTPKYSLKATTVPSCSRTC